MNLEKIYTSPYRSFNFQQLFFYDIFLRNEYFTVLRVIRRRLYDSQPIFYWFFGIIKKKQEK